jgi:choline-glycine betaine transporter
MDFKQWLSSLQALALTMFLFGLLTWVCAVVVHATHPDWISEPIAHYDVPPFNWRLDGIGAVTFATAASGFFVWGLEK